MLRLHLAREVEHRAAEAGVDVFRDVESWIHVSVSSVVYSEDVQARGL